MIEETFIMIKPDGVERGLIGEVISRFEKKLMKVIDIKMLTLRKEEAEKLYEMHKGKDFFEKLIKYSISGPVVVIRLRGEEAVMNCRLIIGETQPEKRTTGTVRGDFSPYLTENVVHASSTQEEAKKELAIFFEI
ncbi:MAG: nucleoside-diphosphate kinase [Caldiserica bacterium]|nr:nucleoside-diphosphate kinase [Caldisericota bacterium]